MTGFDLPESVLWDDRSDVYLVSNIAGEPRARDGDGFISRIGPTGDVVMRWIDGAGDSVALDSPRGMAVAGDLLYVADLSRVRLFDRATGAARGAWEIPGATMLNDVACDGEHLYVSDSGLPAGVAPAGTHAVWKLPLAGDRAVSPVAVIRGPDLGRPNGLAVHGRDLWVATYGSGELFRVDSSGQVRGRERLPGGALDGIVIRDPDTFYLSSWEAQAIYAGRPGGPWSIAIRGVKAPADIGWDARRRRLLVPLLEDGAVEIHPM